MAAEKSVLVMGLYPALMDFSQPLRSGFCDGWRG